MIARSGHGFAVPEGRAVELPGRGTTWILEVEGPPAAPVVVLLHGWMATAELNWFPVFETLGRRYRVIAIDHRGHGRGIRSRRFRLADCADDVAALADVLGVPKVIAVGYSMGGPIAQLLWHRHRDRVGGLVLCATARTFRGPRPIPMVDVFFPAALPGLVLASRLVPASTRLRMIEDFLAARIRNPNVLPWVVSQVGGHDPGAILQAGRALARFTSRSWIGEVDVPTAVVVTERDGLVAPVHQRKLAGAIPGATLHSVDGDHGACVYRPREFSAALLEALASVRSRL